MDAANVFLFFGNHCHNRGNSRMPLGRTIKGETVGNVFGKCDDESTSGIDSVDFIYENVLADFMVDSAPYGDFCSYCGGEVL